MDLQWEKFGRSLREAALDGNRELLDKTAAQEMTLRFVNGPVIAEARCINRRWVVYADGGSKEMFARREYFNRKPDAVEFLVGMRERQTTSPEARICEMSWHNWVHSGGVREGDVFVQRQHCKVCSADRQLRFDLTNGELLSDEDCTSRIGEC